MLSPLSANPQRATFLKTGLMGDLFFREELDVTLETDIDFRLLSSSQKATQRLLSLSGSAGFLCPAGGLWEGRHFVTSSNIGLCREGLPLSVRGWVVCNLSDEVWRPHLTGGSIGDGCSQRLYIRETMHSALNL